MLVIQGDITYLQVIGSMMIVILYLSSLRKGEELRAPRHASAAATRDGNLPIFLTLIEEGVAVVDNGGVKGGRLGGFTHWDYTRVRISQLVIGGNSVIK